MPVINKSKIIWIAVYCLMAIWFFYQVIVLKDGYQRCFIMFMTFISICLILITAFDIKPLIRNIKGNE
jgi:hypothetical protein